MSPVALVRVPSFLSVKWGKIKLKFISPLYYDNTYKGLYQVSEGLIMIMIIIF
jgi:hypothetical protein